MGAMIECQKTRRWYWFILADISVYFGGLLLLIVWKSLTKLCCRLKESVPENSPSSENLNQSQLRSQGSRGKFSFCKAIRNHTNKLVSTQFFIGRIVVLISTLAALLSIVLYLYEIFQKPPYDLERCFPLKNVIYCVDLGCNFIFLIYFLLRFFTSNEKVKFWFGLYTIIDLFTIPQIIVSLILDQEWMGLRFLRVLALMRVPDVMQCFNIIRSGTSIRVIQLSSLFLSILVVGAGFIHLLENSGEIRWDNLYTETQEISFGDSIYFIVVTLSTVGYGDIGAKTSSGRVFVTLFILLVLATFASFIPELAEFLFARSQYLGSYGKESGRKHVIVCGHINYASVSAFLTDFLHEDRSTPDVDVVFINKKEPDTDMKGLLKIYFTQVKYFQGTVMDQMDLNRVQMSNADACLILANQNCSDPYDEDAGNIMRAISFKNFCYQCPVIIQLLQFENKVYLQNIPTWSKRNGDQIICYSEIELGILAQSCMVPGFSTLLSNLFSVRSDKECKQSPLNEDWLNNYMRGITMEIYSSEFSRSFDEYSYRDLVEFCFKNLNLLLIAIEITDPVTKKKILLINPLNCTKISQGTVGYFICDSYKDAINAHVYCSTCHSNLRDLSALTPCKCKRFTNEQNLTIISRIQLEEEISLNKFDIEKDFKEIGYMDDNSMRNRGDFYLCSPQKLLKCVISTEHQTECLNDHIILCIFSDKKTSLIGLKNFLEPLRSTTIPEGELKELVIIADRDFIEKEWYEICSFPKIRVVFHQISINRVVHLIGIEKCSRCVILNSKSNFADLQNDVYMVDKEIVIANLHFQSESRKKIFRNRSKSVAQNSEPVVAGDNIPVVPRGKSLCNRRDTFVTRFNEIHIPIISKLAIESNVQYLEVKEDIVTNIPNYLRKPFAFGCAFTTSMLDSLMSTAYYNQNAIYIMEMLINGGYLDEEEESDYPTADDNLEKSTNKFRINLFSVSQINETINWNNSVFYRDIFIESLRNNDSICLGLYRKRVLSNKPTSMGHVDRYVITNPAANFPIDASDMVYCLQQKCFKSRKKEFPIFDIETK